MAPSAELFSYDDMPNIGSQSIPTLSMMNDPLIIHHQQQQQGHEMSVHAEQAHGSFAHNELDDWLQVISFDSNNGGASSHYDSGAVNTAAVHHSITSPAEDNSSQSFNASLVAENLKNLGDEQKAKILKKIDDRIARLEEVKRRLLAHQQPQNSNLPPQQHGPSCVSPATTPVASDTEESLPVNTIPPSPPIAKAMISPVTPTKSQEEESRASNKRKHSDETDSASDDESDGGSSDNGNTDVSQQKLQRREQNRLSAKKSRAKKKQKVQTMNKLLANLKEENKKLREYVDEKLGKAEVQTLLVQKRAEAKKQESKLATQNFVAALRNPANRILDIDMMDFLDQLRQDFISGQRS